MKERTRDMINALAIPPRSTDDNPDDLTAEEARTLADDLGRDLYLAQDALAFVEECCVIADREQRTITTADVREWLKGAQCGRQLVAGVPAGTGGTQLGDSAGDPTTPPLGFVVNPQTGTGVATGGNTPSAATGYCPACGRGDCAPTADQYEQQRQKAARAEAALREVLDAFEAYWARASYCGPNDSAVQPEHFQAWRAVLTPAAAPAEANCAYPHGKPGIASLLEHVGLDTSRGITVAGRFVAQPCTCGGTSPINHLFADQHLPVPDSGPTVAEAAQADRNWDLERHGE
ncbi:hypothetical protein ABT076_10665 [Streptomyces sp. NPDC002131]|uniref:hypothetical protein n=1 Tax=Streptomyces sp. NPDC002131 TaxID=3154535 RepID=UPI00332C9C69